MGSLVRCRTASCPQRRLARRERKASARYFPASACCELSTSLIRSNNPVTTLASFLRQRRFFTSERYSRLKNTCCGNFLTVSQCDMWSTPARCLLFYSESSGYSRFLYDHWTNLTNSPAINHNYYRWGQNAQSSCIVRLGELWKTFTLCEPTRPTRNPFHLKPNHLTDVVFRGEFTVFALILAMC